MTSMKKTPTDHHTIRIVIPAKPDGAFFAEDVNRLLAAFDATVDCLQLYRKLQGEKMTIKDYVNPHDYKFFVDGKRFLIEK